MTLLAETRRGAYELAIAETWEGHVMMRLQHCNR